MQIQLKHLIYRSFSSLSLSLIARLKKRFVRFRLPKRPKSLFVSSFAENHPMSDFRRLRADRDVY